MTDPSRSTPQHRTDTAAPAGGLWGGRFEGGMAPEMVPLNLSLEVDRRLWREDVRGSVGWTRALERAGVLRPEEASELRRGLEAVAERLERARLDGPGWRERLGDPGDEDVHALVERLLGEEVGALAGKLHTGRSRNDQVATDVRLWTVGRAEAVDAELVRLGRALVGLAERTVDVIMPGYTHLQQGQPVRAAHWALSYVWPLVRDRGRLAAAADAAAVLPLGSGAIAGCPFPVDREALARDLGFRGVTTNSIDAVGDRDFLLDFVYAGAAVGLHVSRLAEDLVLFGSREFGFVRLSDGYSTGSSLMPQKRNPDVAELTRGKSARLVGNLVQTATLLKGLPTGYNRDLQEDKRALFDTADTLLLTLPALAGAVETAELDGERIRTAMDAQLLATDLADHLVRAGVPFRTAHEVVGTLVRRSEREGRSLGELDPEAYREAHPAFGDDARALFDLERSVESRDTLGGTSRRAVEDQLRRARAALASLPGGREG